MTTYRRLALSAALGAVMAAAVIHAPEARADSSSFLDAVHELGWYNRVSGDVGLLNQGYAVCNALAQGYNGLEVAEAIYRNTGLDVDRNDAAEFVILSVENLCPQFDHRGQEQVA